MKLIKIVLLSILTFFYFAAIQAEEAGKAISLNIGTEHEFTSKLLNESRRYLVHLPESYNKENKNYPVIYILDGESHFQHAVSAIKVLQRYERIPELIVVGIPNNSGTRWRDLGQNKEQFLIFIESELMTLINKTYRTQGNNTLFGHSLAGYFTLNAMAENHNIFANYIAASPHLLVNDGDIQAKLKTQKLAAYNSYFSMADELGDGKERVDALYKLVEFLNQQVPKNLSWKFESLESQEHMTTPYLTIYNGLTFVFKDYQPPQFSNYEDYNKKGGIKGVENYYKKRGDKYALDNKVSANMMSRLANMLIDEDKFVEAIALLKNNIVANPKSLRAHFDLARVYQENGERKLALQKYQSAQNLLNPENMGFREFIAEQIKALEVEK